MALWDLSFTNVFCIDCLNELPIRAHHCLLYQCSVSRKSHYWSGLAWSTSYSLVWTYQFRNVHVFSGYSVQSHLSGRSMEWNFKVPWWEGCLNERWGQLLAASDSLLMNSTLLWQKWKAIINSRPPSYISSNDLEEPLTRSHLLMARQVLRMPVSLLVQMMRITSLNQPQLSQWRD